jgi:hypothetical protein
MVGRNGINMMTQPDVLHEGAAAVCKRLTTVDISSRDVGSVHQQSSIIFQTSSVSPKASAFAGLSGLRLCSRTHRVTLSLIRISEKGCFPENQE